MPTFLDKLLWLFLPILPVNLAWFFIKKRMRAMHVRQTRTEPVVAPTSSRAASMMEFDVAEEDTQRTNAAYDSYRYCPCGRCTFDPLNDEGQENE